MPRLTRPRWSRLFALLAVLAGLLGVPAAVFGVSPAAADEPSSASAAPTTFCVNEIERQVSSLKHHPEALGFRLGAGAGDPTKGRHYQGVSRVPSTPDSGPPHLVVSRNGNPGFGEIASSGPGELNVVEMGSRDGSGERMRSNRLAVNKETEHTPPPAEDRIIRSLKFDGTGPNGVWPDDPQALPAYRHLGGMQMWGDVAVVGMDTKFGPSTSEGMIVLMDLADPANPVKLHEFPVPHKASFIGVLDSLLITGGHNANPVFGLTFSKSDLRAADLELTPAFAYDAEGANVGWPGSYDSLQTANLFRECQTGKIYLLGAHHSGLPLPDSGYEWVQLWELTPQAEQKLTLVHEHMVNCDWDNVGRVCNFAAASGYYVSPSGDLLLYATPHDNDGPKADKTGTVGLAEFASQDGYDQGDAFRPLAVPGDYEAAQNKPVTLDGTRSRGARAAGRVELYDDLGGRSLVIDHPDMGQEDYSDLGKVDKFNDEASWARSRLPEGCDVVLHDDRNHRGPQFLIEGTGKPEVTRLTNFDDDASSVQMSGDSCDGRIVDYYWDLDANGSIDARGATPTIVPPKAGKIKLALDVCTGFVNEVVVVRAHYCDHRIGTIDVKGDAVIPTTKATLTGTAGTNDWYRSAVTVQLAATGVPDPTQITYSATGADPMPSQTVDGSSATLTVDAQGQTTVRFRAANAAGEEAEQAVTVKVDSIAPTVEVLNPAEGGTYSLNFAWSVSATCADAGSGVQSCLPAGAPLDTATAGPKTLTATATDAAGNTSTLPVHYTVTATPATTAELVVEALDERSHGVVQRLNADGTNLVQLAASGEDPVWSPDGSRIAFVAPGEGGRRQVHVMNRDGSNAVRLTNDAGYSASAPAWSPDGARILYAARWTEIVNGQGVTHAALRTVPPAGGATTTLASVAGVNLEDPTYTRDGSAITFIADHDVRSIPAAGVPDGQLGTALVSGLHWYQDPYRPAWSPDGQSLVFGLSTREINTSDLYMLTGDGSPLNLTGDDTSWPPQEGTTAPNEFSPTWLPDGRLLFTQDGDIWAMPAERLGAKVRLADLPSSVRSVDARGV